MIAGISIIIMIRKQLVLQVYCPPFSY